MNVMVMRIHRTLLNIFNGGSDGNRSTQQGQQDYQLVGAQQSIACRVLQLSDQFQIHAAWWVARLRAGAWAFRTLRAWQTCERSASSCAATR